MGTLGSRIKKARENKKLLQSELAERIMVKSSGVISNWEKDLNKPDAEKIVALCIALDVTPSYLLDYYGKSPDDLTEDEHELIRKYRLIDERGKTMVQVLLDAEYESCAKQTRR